MYKWPSQKQGGLASITMGPTEWQVDGKIDRKGWEPLSPWRSRGNACESNPKWLDDAKSKQPSSLCWVHPRKWLLKRKEAEEQECSLLPSCFLWEASVSSVGHTPCCSKPHPRCWSKAQEQMGGKADQKRDREWPDESPNLGPSGRWRPPEIWGISDVLPKNLNRWL